MTIHVGDGEKGTGKTMTLCHVVHYCTRQGWLVLHIPDGKNTDAVCVITSNMHADPEDAASRERCRVGHSKLSFFFHSGEGI